jgi:hypothetical protein
MKIDPIETIRNPDNTVPPSNVVVTTQCIFRIWIRSLNLTKRDVRR